MIRPIIHDPLFLGQQSKPATEADRQIITDLMDTLRANLDRCVGMGSASSCSATGRCKW